MITKDKLKKEIEKLPNDLLEKVYKYIHSLKTEENEKKIRTFRLKGQLDDINIRDKAYE